MPLVSFRRCTTSPQLNNVCSTSDYHVQLMLAALQPHVEHHCNGVDRGCYDDDTVSLFPRELCVLFTPTFHGGGPQIVVVFLHRFWTTSRSSSHNIVLLGEDYGSAGTTILKHKTRPVHTHTSVKCSQRAAPSTERLCLNSVHLPSGLRFYKDRVILYCDDSTSHSHLYPKGSVGGSYFAAIGMCIHTRQRSLSIRNVSLTRTGYQQISQ